MGQGLGAGPYGKCMGQVHGTSACDEETGHGQGHGTREWEKGIEEYGHGYEIRV